MVAPKFEITRHEIDCLVREFYVRARRHPTLGPIFLAVVGDTDEVWRAHEAKIASFWRNAIGLDRSFNGNPMLKHLARPEIQPEQFPVWLELFHDTARDTLPPEAARSIGALADRIGQSLRWGMEQFRQKDGLPPRLSGRPAEASSSDIRVQGGIDGIG